MEKVIDYSEALDCLTAHGKGRNVLILRRLDKHIKRFDGKKAQYVLEHRWLSCDCENEKDQAWACCQGQDYTYWQGSEIAKAIGSQNLFDHFCLFGG